MSTTYCDAPQGSVMSGPTQGRSFGQAIDICLRKSFVWSGRAPRSEYWFWTLFYSLAYVGTLIVGSALGGDAGRGLAYLCYLAVTILPTLAVTIRRLHDLDRSGWWMLMYLVPLVGGILLLIWFCMRGTESANRFGPDPLAVVQDTLVAA